MKVDKPSEVRDLIIKIIEDILDKQKEIPQAGTISHMLGVWLKAWELDKVSDIEARLETLEKAQRRN